MARTTKIMMVCLVLVGLAGWVCGCGKKSETPPSARPVESAEMAAPAAAPAAAEAITDTPLAPEPGTRVVTLAITGMHCDACAQTISQKLGEVLGVRKAHASFPAKTAWVMVDRRGGPDIGELIKTVEAAGYKAAPALSAGPTTAPQ